MDQPKLPQSFKSYFWDVDFNKLAPKKDANFILKRLLDRGNTQAILWVNKNYTPQDIKSLLTTTRDLDTKTAKFWADVYKLNYSQVPCLQKPYSPIHFGLYS